MSSLQIKLPNDLSQRVVKAAQVRGISVNDFVEDSLKEQLRNLEEQTPFSIKEDKLSTEIAAFDSMFEYLKSEFFGKVVAIHEGQLVDSGDKFEDVYMSVRETYGNVAILIRKVTDEPIRVFNAPRSWYRVENRTR